MAVKGCNWSKKSQEDVDDLDLLDSCDECDKKFITGHDFEFHQRMFHAEDENSREYTLNQASALRITQLIGAQVQDVRCISNMILYGAERETPINVNSMLMECLSKVILEAPIENEYEMRTENAMPTKFIETADESDLRRIVHLINGGTVRMTPLEKLGVLSTLSALAMGEFCGDIDPVENISAEGIVADDPEWLNANNAVPEIRRKRGRPRKKEPVIGPKRPRGRPRLAENVLRKSRESKKSFRVGSGVFRMPAAIAGFNKKANKEKDAKSSAILSMDLSRVKARMAERWRATTEDGEEIRENVADVDDNGREMRVHSSSGLKMKFKFARV